jgi:hypothetical protein
MANKIKKAICKLSPDVARVKIPLFGDVTWYDIRDRLGCPQTETKETCFNLNDKRLCIVERPQK